MSYYLGIMAVHVEPMKTCLVQTVTMRNADTGTVFNEKYNYIIRANESKIPKDSVHAKFNYSSSHSHLVLSLCIQSGIECISKTN